MPTKKEWTDRIKKAKTRAELSKVEEDAAKGHGLSDKDARAVHDVLTAKTIELGPRGELDAQPQRRN
jgi:hypothetical protein